MTAALTPDGRASLLGLLQRVSAGVGRSPGRAPPAGGAAPTKLALMTVAPAAELLDYDDVVARYEPVLGLEVHVELSTATKMFCGCANMFGAEPNTQVCPVCLGLPGSLPVLNQAAVESAIRIGLALNCEIVPWCRFARKNYFYPDMPKNYQISQYDEPIAINGYLDVPLDDGTTWRVEIERAHMEEDTGKLTHLGSETGRIEGATTSLIDYNRAGVPLIEIVTKPIEGTGERAPEIARAYVTALRDLLRALGVSDVRMDQGSMRCDANVSLKPNGATEFGTRTETKNVNSLKSVEVAVRYEMRRQAAVLVAGGRVHQETRHFHEDGYTSPGRSKETAQDYRYFPEPDLEPVAPSAELVERLRETIPELPWLSRKRIQQEWGISDEVMRDLVNAGAIDLVAATVEHGASSEAARAWWGNFLVQKANEAGVELDALAITPGAGRRGGEARRRRQAVQQAGASGRRGRAGRRGRTRAGDDGPRTRTGPRRLADPGRCRRGAGRQSRCGGKDPGRQGGRGGRHRRRGDEGHQRPGGRGPRTRIGTGRLQLGLCAQHCHRGVGVILQALARIGVRVVDRQPAQHFGEPQHGVGQLIRGQPGRSEQIGPSDVTDEQRVTGEDPERLGAVAVLIDHDADRLGRVSWRRPDLELYLTEVDPLSVDQGFDVEVGLRALAVTYGRSVGSELEMTREEVGVNVGLDDPLDPQAVLGRVLQIDRHVAVRVHHNRPAGGLVADQIRQLRQTAQDVLLEEHNSSLRSSRSFVGVPDAPNSVAKEVDRIHAASAKGRTGAAGVVHRGLLARRWRASTHCSSRIMCSSRVGQDSRGDEVVANSPLQNHRGVPAAPTVPPAMPERP